MSELSGISKIDSVDLVPITVFIPKDALNLLSFRYYELGIAENNEAMVSAATQEIVRDQFQREFSSWKNRAVQVENSA